MKKRKLSLDSVLEGYKEYTFEGPIYRLKEEIKPEINLTINATSIEHAKAILMHRLTQGKESINNWDLSKGRFVTTEEVDLFGQKIDEKPPKKQRKKRSKNNT